MVVDDVIETYPTLQAIVPAFFFSGDMTKPTIEIGKQIDDHLARSKSGVHRGTYILTEVQKA